MYILSYLKKKEFLAQNIFFCVGRMNTKCQQHDHSVSSDI